MYKNFEGKVFQRSEKKMREIYTENFRGKVNFPYTLSQNVREKTGLLVFKCQRANTFVAFTEYTTRNKHYSTYPPVEMIVPLCSIEWQRRI